MTTHPPRFKAGEACQIDTTSFGWVRGTILEYVGEIVQINDSLYGWRKFVLRGYRVDCPEHPYPAEGTWVFPEVALRKLPPDGQESIPVNQISEFWTPEGKGNEIKS